MIILTVVILDFSTLSATNVQFLTTKRYDEPHRHFHIRVAPRKPRQTANIKPYLASLHFLLSPRSLP